MGWVRGSMGWGSMGGVFRVSATWCVPCGIEEEVEG